MRSTRGNRRKRPPRLNSRLDSRTRRRDRNTEALITRGGVVGLTVVTAVFILGVVLANWSRTDAQDSPAGAQAAEITQVPPAGEATPSSKPFVAAPEFRKFSRCGAIRRTCVIDGDTFWLDGQKIRIADIDTPEVGQPRCAHEKKLGDRATDRLIMLLNQGPFEVVPIGGRDEDQYGRKLRVIMRDNGSLGDQLVAEGLARTWTGQREPWC